MAGETIDRHHLCQSAIDQKMGKVMRIGGSGGAKTGSANRRLHEGRVRRKRKPATSSRPAFIRTKFAPGARHLRRQAELSDPIKKSTRDAHRGRILNCLIPGWGDRPFPYFEEDGFFEEFTDWPLELKRVSRKAETNVMSVGINANPPSTISNSLRNNIIETMSLGRNQIEFLWREIHHLVKDLQFLWQAGGHWKNRLASSGNSIWRRMESQPGRQQPGTSK
jgi:hypothetical protein